MKLSKSLERVLSRRGLTVEDLKPLEEYPEYSLINLKDGTKQFMRNIMNNKLIGILYDVDTDGLSAGKIMSDYLKALGVNYKYTMNSNKHHGMNEEVMQWVEKEGIDYLIIVDAGVNDIDYYNRLNEQNVEVLVLDHHKVSSVDILVSNGKTVIINNNYEGSPNKDLSGAGVTYRFIHEMNKDFGIKGIEKYQSWVGLSVHSDRCNILNKENRYYVKYLYDNYKNEELFRQFTNYGSLENMFNFTVIPLLNSCIRMERQDIAMELVNNRHPKAMKKLIEDAWEVYNLQKELVEEALKTLKYANGKNFIVCRLDDDKYKGIVGLVAAKVKSKTNKATIVLLKTEEGYKGSFRGNEFITSAQLDEIGISTAGHDKACGVFISPDNFKEQVKALMELEIDKSNYVEYEYLVNDVEFYKYTKDLWNIAILNEFSGNGFEKIKVKISNIGRTPSVRVFEKMVRYNYVQFEVVDFDMSCDPEVERYKNEIFVTPVLNGKNYTLVKI